MVHPSHPFPVTHASHVPRAMPLMPPSPITHAAPSPAPLPTPSFPPHMHRVCCLALPWSRPPAFPSAAGRLWPWPSSPPLPTSHSPRMVCPHGSSWAACSCMRGMAVAASRQEGAGGDVPLSSGCQAYRPRPVRVGAQRGSGGTPQVSPPMHVDT